METEQGLKVNAHRKVASIPHPCCIGRQGDR